MTLPGLIFWIWTIAVVLCAAFAAWYFNWRGALNSLDVNRYMDHIKSRGSMTAAQLEAFREFISNDDGKEFVMLNVIKFHDRKQPHPQTGELTAPVKLISEYQKRFLGNLVKRAGHPLYIARKAGGYIDTFGVAPPEYSVASMVRYRSRKDFADAIVNSDFSSAHEYKTAAIEHTFNFPTRMQRIGVWGAGRIFPMILILIAALLHIAVVTLRG